jgi:hypothetical protein
MDKINHLLRQYSQKNYEKRIQFPYSQTSTIAFDIYKKYKSRYENLMEKNQQDFSIIQNLIKDKYVLGCFSSLKKQKKIPKIVNALYFDNLNGISRLFTNYEKVVSSASQTDSENEQNCLLIEPNELESKPNYYENEIIVNETNHLLQNSISNETNGLLQKSSISNEPNYSIDYVTETNCLETERNDELSKESNELSNAFKQKKRKIKEDNILVGNTNHFLENQNILENQSNDSSFREKQKRIFVEISEISIFNVQITKMVYNNTITISNKFLFSLLYSIDVLYLNWMKFDDETSSGQVESDISKNIYFFNNYLTSQIYSKIPKNKQKKYIEALSNSENYHLIYEFICAIFNINLVVKSLDTDIYEIFPKELKFDSNKRTIFILDLAPTYLGNSNILPNHFWNNYFRLIVTPKSKISILREFIFMFGLQLEIDIKNKKSIVEQNLLPYIELTFPL